VSVCALLISTTLTAALAEEPAGEGALEPGPRPVFLALPLVSYDSNLRLGLGAFGQVILPDPSGETPYRANLSTQLLFTTGGYQNHFLRADLPALGGSRWRLMVTARRIAWTRAPYYGLGPDSARSEDPEHDLWAQSRWLLRADARAGLPGPFEVFGALNVQREGVSADPNARLSQEQPLGFDGGRLVWLGAGVIYEGRDNEVNPRRGLAADLSFRVSSPWLGSDWAYQGVNLGVRGAVPLGDRVVWASNLIVDARFGEEPFFTMSSFAGLSRGGVLGGRWTLRGLPEERLRGDGVALTQHELRVTVIEHTVRGAPWAWSLVPFVDVGQVWLWDAPPPETLALGAGLGLRLVAKELLVLRVDVARSVDTYAEAPTRRPSTQVLVLSEHPF
jgi:hypothetical protein